jgi:hypothetical protein
VKPLPSERTVPELITLVISNWASICAAMSLMKTFTSAYRLVHTDHVEGARRNLLLLHAQVLVDSLQVLLDNLERGAPDRIILPALSHQLPVCRGALVWNNWSLPGDDLRGQRMHELHVGKVSLPSGKLP